MRITGIVPVAAVMLATLAGVSGCKKYPEGPAFTVNPKNARIANHWIVARAMENGQDVTDQYDHYDLILQSDGDAELDANYYFFGSHVIVVTHGTWMLTHKSENLFIDYENDDLDVEYQILRLKENEMWLRQVGADLELELVSAY